MGLPDDEIGYLKNRVSHDVLVDVMRSVFRDKICHHGLDTDGYAFQFFGHGRLHFYQLREVLGRLDPFRLSSVGHDHELLSEPDCYVRQTKPFRRP